jgi:hypothetical protein
MKKNFPKAVAAGIMAQNKLIKNTWVIILVGIPRNVMPQLKENIRKSPGITGISETNRTDQSGRWNILVKKANFKSARKHFTKNIQDWVSDLTPELQSSIPDTFPAPKVYQKNSYDDDNDDSSFGQASYMSSCAQSYASFEDNDTGEQLFNPPGKYNLYASALSATVPTPTGTDVLIPEHRRTTRVEQPNPEHVQTNAYQTMIANLQHEVTIAQLQAEIQTLKADLCGVTTPSTVTKISTPISTTQEPSTTVDRMATIKNNMEILTQQFSTWMTELRNNAYGQSAMNTNPLEPQQTIRETVLQEASSDAGTKHSSEEDLASQRLKRVNTCTMPT